MLQLVYLDIFKLFMNFFTKVLKNSNSLNLIKRIWFQIERDRKSEVIQLIFFMTFCGVSEIISLSAIVPFIGIITNPEKVLDYQFLNTFFQNFNLTDRENLINFVTIIFVSSALVTGLVRLITIKKSALCSIYQKKSEAFFFFLPNSI